jgi:hypothetical protein
MDQSRDAYFPKFFNKLIPYWAPMVFCTIGLAELIYFSLRGKGYDFPVFYDAGRLFLNFQSPWDAVIDPIYSAYLNGPLTALIISPLALVPQDIALGITRVLSIVLIPFLTLQISKYFFPFQELSYLNKKIWLASSFILFTFPVRANLEYGQFFIVFLAFAISALRFSRYESIKFLLLAGFLIGLCCDYKPQCFIIFALLICFKNRYIFLGGILSVISGALLSAILTHKPPYLVWGEVIFKRFKGGVTGDQMHIYTVFPGFWSRLILTVICAIALLYFFLHRHNLNNPYINVLTIFLTVFLSPWMHPTDLVLFSLFAVGIALQGNGLTFISSLALGSLLVWSNNLVISILIAILSVSTLFLYLGRNHKKYMMKVLFIVSPPIIFAFVSNKDPDVEGLLRKIFGLVSLLCITALVAIYGFGQSRKDSRTKI